MNWSEFLAMGGYALYVWTSYALFAVVLVWNLWLPRRRRARLVEQLKMFYQLKSRESAK